MTVPRTEAQDLDPHSPHERDAADLRDEIMGGDLPPGAELPSTAQLTARFSASNATMQKALQPTSQQTVPEPDLWRTVPL